MSNRPRALAPILQLNSPSLPVGAYAYSAGLEYAVDAGWITDEDEAFSWISNVTAYSLTRQDLPVLRQLYRAWLKSEKNELRYWSSLLIALRETSELLQEDQHLGIALARLLSDLGVERAQQWITSSATTWATMYSLAASEWQIEEEDMCFGYLWTWCDNQIAAAIKLVPLGQTAGQRMLFNCGELLPALVEQSRHVEEASIGRSLPAVAIASSLHEQQYSRLFRS